MNKGNRLLTASLVLFAATAIHGVRSDTTTEALASHCKSYGQGAACGPLLYCGGPWTEDGYCTDPQVAQGYFIVTDRDGCTAEGRLCP